MQLSTNRIFLQSAAKDFKRTGAVAPSSKILAQAMTRPLARYHGKPVAILEVGAGTGSITQEIARYLADGDTLDIYEIDRRFACLLQRRILEEDGFRETAADVTIYNESIERINKAPKYDFIISCLPFTNFASEKVREIFEIYRSALKPGGICSFYEYVLVRRAVKIVCGNSIERGRVSRVERAVREHILHYGCGHELVVRNLPPAQVHHLRFSKQTRHIPE